MNLNFWPFKKKPAPKPRIMRFEKSTNCKHGDWRCGVELVRYRFSASKVGMQCRAPMGEGRTPQDAYADWKRQVEAGK